MYSVAASENSIPTFQSLVNPRLHRRSCASLRLGFFPQSHATNTVTRCVDA
nr:MAG TPA: hypothetical protein [Caudoviricetes sp.]